MPSSKKNQRPKAERLKGAPLELAPENELGVVFLFSQLARKWRLKIEQIRPQFPDCIAYQKVQNGERRIRIEFEFKSRNFKNHGHSANGCDWIVCWEHNWPSAPKSLQIIELRREYGLGFNVWIQPVSGDYGEELSTRSSAEYWTAPSLAHKGDLLLFYHTSPDQCIRDIFTLSGAVEHVTAGWKPGKDYQGPIKRVCQLKSPIFFEDLKRDRILRTANFVRGRMIGRQNATEYWPYIFDKIIRRNPSVRNRLRKFSPDQLNL